MRKSNYFIIAALAALAMSCAKTTDSDTAKPSHPAADTTENAMMNDGLAPIEEAPGDTTATAEPLDERAPEGSPLEQTKEIFHQGMKDFNACKRADDVYQAVSKFVKNQGRLSLLQDKMTPKERAEAEKLGAEFAKVISKTIQKHHCDQTKIDQIFSGM